MFTGLIETTGEVLACERETLIVGTPTLAGQLNPEQSIAVDGVCLTICEVDAKGSVFKTELSPETRRRTTLGRLSIGQRVNLERPLLANGQLGGHFVLGHVDTVGQLVESIPEGRFVRCIFAVAPEFDPLLIEKGSVAVDGISLTCFDINKGRFAVAIIPKTLEIATLGAKGPGSPVNVEFDVLGKYVLKAMENLRANLMRRMGR